MSVKVMHLVWQHAPYSAGSLLVLLALADWADDDGTSWPSMKQLAKKARIERRSAQRIVRQLERDGVLTIAEGKGRKRQHRYGINLEGVTKCRPLVPEQGDIPDTQGATLNARGATSDTQGATPVSPDPSVDPLEGSTKKDPPYKSGEFLSTLRDFEQHRKEIKKPLQPTGRKLLYAQLGRMGEAQGTAAMQTSIANGWQGVFEPNGRDRERESKNSAGRQRQSDTTDDFVFTPRSIIE